MRPDAQTFDTVATMPTGGRSYLTKWGFYSEQLYFRGPYYSVSTNGSVIARLDNENERNPWPVRMRIRIGDGREVATSLTLRTEATTARVLDSAIAERASAFMRIAGRSMPAGTTAAEVQKEFASVTYRPRFAPPVRGVLATNSGEVWLEGVQRPDGQQWFRVRPDGTPDAIVTVPANARIVAAARDRLWGVVLDDMDVPTVLLLQVRSAAR
jgi:hypothetical protein